MPPRRTIASSARTLYGEPDPPVYFPPAGQGANGFSSYVSPGYAANLALQDEEDAARRDDMITRKADNLLRRASAASTYGLLPYNTAASRARLDFVPKQIAAEEELLPFQTEYSKEQAITGIQDSQLHRENAPDIAQFGAEERSARRAMRAEADPQEDDLQRMTKDPGHILAYRSFLAKTDPKLAPAQRRKVAYNQALKLAHDAPAVDAIESEALNNEDPEFRKKFLEDSVDPDTGQRLTRLKPNADPATVNGLVRKHAEFRMKQAQDREERQRQREDRLEQQQLQKEWHDRVIAHQAMLTEASKTDSGVAPEDVKAMREFHKVLLNSQPGSGKEHLPKAEDKKETPLTPEETEALRVKAAAITGEKYVPPLPAGKSYLEEAMKRAQK